MGELVVDCRNCQGFQTCHRKGYAVVKDYKVNCGNHIKKKGASN